MNAREELIHIAAAMINNEMNLIDGVRRLAALRHDLEDQGNNELFRFLRAVDSETDHFPRGESRAQWAEGYLLKADHELEEYLADTKEEILSVCRDLLRTYS